MKVIVIGAGGAVGKTAVDALASRHEIITVGRSSGDLQADIEDIDSIRAMYQQIGKVDAVVSAVGHGHFGMVHEMTSEQFMQGITHKVLPQVNLVLEGFEYMNDGANIGNRNRWNYRRGDHRGPIHRHHRRHLTAI